MMEVLFKKTSSWGAIQKLARALCRSRERHPLGRLSRPADVPDNIRWIPPKPSKSATDSLRQVEDGVLDGFGIAAE
jgi:hypothetical protein